MDAGAGVDALVPIDMAEKAERVGLEKAEMEAVRTFVLAVLAGAFIALGAVFATTVAAGASATLPYGLKQLLVGVVFSLGLILVLVGGAELFTGNCMIVMAWANRRVTTARLLRNWGIVYLGNFVGSVGTVVLVYWSEQYTFGSGAVGAAALATAKAKTTLGWGQAVALGILCNALVCLAVWLTFSARTTIDRVAVIVPPIAAFVAAGFEHSVANMYFVPLGILIRNGAPESFWLDIEQSPAAYETVEWGQFVAGNLLPVTIGNLIGGGVLVATVYWFVYLRRARSEGRTRE